jgi:DNA ligase (NAD+)
MSDLDREADTLERVKRHLDTLYEQGEPCIHPDTGEEVSDPEYDRLVARLAKIRPNSKELKLPTSSTLASDAKKVRHDPPMTSISKAIGPLADRTKQLDDWMAKCRQELKYHDMDEDPENFSLAYKLDGVACALYYEKGVLKAAGLRPRNGVDGEDVTANIVFVEGVVEKLPFPITCSIRGEIYCKKSTFEKKNKELVQAGEKPFANPRNYATGSIRQFKNPQITKERELSFRAYSIWGQANPPYSTEYERAIYCNQKLGIPFVRVSKFRPELLQELEDKVPDLDYEVDGLVISVSDLDAQEQMGTHGGSATGNPKGKIAWKFTEEVGQAKVKTITWNVGRTGKLTPVLNFDPIPLAGTQVSWCTGHNIGYLRRTGVGVGTVIRVIKSGKIIPKVDGVVSNAKTPEFPHKCPTCGNKLRIEAGSGQGMESLVCDNEFCGERAISHLLHYLATFGVKGVGESTVTKLYENGLVKHPADFYKVQVVDLIKADGLDPRDTKKDYRAQFLDVARIHMVPAPEKIKDKKALSDAIEAAAKHKKKIPLWQFFASLGIQGAGKTTGQALESHYGSFDAIRKATVDELQEVDGVGQTTAEDVHAFFAKNRTVVDELLQYVELTLPKTGKLTGKQFVFTGGFPEGKEHWEKAVREEGGKTGSSVSKKTDYVVVGDNAGVKEQKADELGIKKLSLQDLKKLL